jgi:putative nucleotidyltransferase with HDIG domain
VPTNGQRRTRIERVAALELPPNFWERLWERVQQGEVWLRVAMCAAAAVVMWGVIEGWNPPFSYRTGYTPRRDIISRVEFERLLPAETELARAQAANQVRYVYEQDPSQLEQLRNRLVTDVSELASAEKRSELRKGLWESFSPPPQPNVVPSEKQEDEMFATLRGLIDSKEKVAELEKKVRSAFTEIEQNGILKEPQTLGTEKTPTRIAGDQVSLDIHPEGRPSFPQVVKFTEVIKPAPALKLLDRLKAELGADVGQRLYYWLGPKLQDLETLSLNRELTTERREAARRAAPLSTQKFVAGDAELAKAGLPLDAATRDLLQLEHDALLAQRTTGDKLYRSLAIFGMFFALFTLAGFYIYFRNPVLLVDLRKFTRLLVLFVLAVSLGMMASGDRLRAEIIPILVFGMTVGIAYNQELALLLTAALGLVIVIALGQDLSAYVIILSAAATSILLLGRVRTRRRLIYVGAIAGGVVALTAIGVNVVTHQPLNLPTVLEIVREAHRDFWWTIFASFLVTGLLPFVEKTFDVLTDLSLLEIGDPSHPLLQELVRRAPGTYNHSINVASLAEAAAEAIGAQGLLVRVGAYFHDIGKMLKPGYFVENQGLGANRHESLLPAMSTLVIIAHIKDGADLARQHHLPQPIIDFIQQHHGTTLVEYFYNRASEQSESDPHGGEVDESSFRYPGPKPQTKEAAVLMLADASESASRALVDPTPGRIEGLIQDLAMKRLLDGQFDECGLTLSELRSIEDSLIKSLIAVYHGRVKYPDQRTA